MRFFTCQGGRLFGRFLLFGMLSVLSWGCTESDPQITDKKDCPVFSGYDDDILIVQLGRGILPEDLVGDPREVIICEQLISDWKDRQRRGVVLRLLPEEYEDLRKEGKLEKSSCRSVTVGEEPAWNAMQGYLDPGRTTTARGFALIPSGGMQATDPCVPYVVKIKIENIGEHNNVVQTSSNDRQNDIIWNVDYNRPLRMGDFMNKQFIGIAGGNSDCVNAVMGNPDIDPEAARKEEVGKLLEEIEKLSFKEAFATDEAVEDCETYYVTGQGDPSPIKVGIADSGMDFTYSTGYLGNPFFRTGMDAWERYNGRPPRYYSDTYPVTLYGERLSDLLAALSGNYPSLGEEAFPPACEGFAGYDFYNGNNFPQDYHGHGTAMASTILSTSRDDVKVASLKIGDVESGDSLTLDLTSAIQAIFYAIDEDVDVLNISWGYYDVQESEILRSAIDSAAEMGMIMVMSVGNDGVNIDSCTMYPAAFKRDFEDNIITVAALNVGNDEKVDSTLAPFSNYGSIVDIAAPGILYGWQRGSENGLQRFQGTSMAAAYVSRRVGELLATGTPRRADDLLSAMGSRSVTGADFVAPARRLVNETGFPIESPGP